MVSEGVGEARAESEGELALARVAWSDGELRHAAAHLAQAIAADPSLPAAYKALDELDGAPGGALDLFPVEGRAYIGMAAARSYLLARAGDVNEALGLLCTPLPGDKARLITRYRGMGFVSPAARAIRPDAGLVPRIIQFAALRVPGVDLGIRALDFFVADPLHNYLETGCSPGSRHARKEGAPVPGALAPRPPPWSPWRTTT